MKCYFTLGALQDYKIQDFMFLYNESVNLRQKNIMMSVSSAFAVCKNKTSEGNIQSCKSGALAIF